MNKAIFVLVALYTALSSSVAAASPQADLVGLINSARYWQVGMPPLQTHPTLDAISAWYAGYRIGRPGHLGEADECHSDRDSTNGMFAWEWARTFGVSVYYGFEVTLCAGYDAQAVMSALMANQNFRNVVFGCPGSRCDANYISVGIAPYYSNVYIWTIDAWRIDDPIPSNVNLPNTATATPTIAPTITPMPTLAPTPSQIVIIRVDDRVSPNILPTIDWLCQQVGVSCAR